MDKIKSDIIGGETLNDNHIKDNHRKNLPNSYHSSNFSAMIEKNTPHDNRLPDSHKAASELNSYMVNELFQEMMTNEKSSLFEEDENDNCFSNKSDVQKIYNKMLINEMAKESTKDLPHKGIDIAYTVTKKELDKKTEAVRLGHEMMMKSEEDKKIKR